MPAQSSERARAILAELRARRPRLTDTWTPQQRKAFSDPSRRVAILCSRRAGKTYAGNSSMLDLASRTKGGRFLYINSTTAEARRLAWVGNRQDGMMTLAKAHKMRCSINEARMEIHFPHLDSFIFILGADDEASIRKALGSAFHLVWWDEAQKIPPHFNDTIEQVLMPTLLDFKGKLQLTGTPVPQMGSLFYQITREEEHLRRPGWAVHRWDMLSNPFFGATHDERMTNGVLDLQTMYGGPEVAPLDSPLMQRDAFGRWVAEVESFVYRIRAVPRERLVYAPARILGDVPLYGRPSGPTTLRGFPDIPRALMDLPGWPDRAYHVAGGFDLGIYPDPFAFVLWAWSLLDEKLYEVASWRQTHLISDEHVAVINLCRDAVHLAIMVADASGGGAPVVAGWAEGWRERHAIPIVEADKPNKAVAIETMNTDIIRERLALREGGALIQEMETLQWAKLLTAAGKRIEDPTMPNDVCDGGLYSHRHTYHHRFRPAEEVPQPGTPEHDQREAKLLEEDTFHAAQEEIDGDEAYPW